MQNIQNNGIGVTQFNGMKPRNVINMGGVEWILKRDATDSSAVFPHQKVNWLNAGCEPLGDGRVNYCWIMGVIAPTPNSIERPVNVMYVGFHPQRILVAPNAVSQADMDRMHVYVSDSSNFVGEFVGKFLGIEPEKPIEARESISPWPPMLDQEILSAKPEQRVAQQPQPAPPQPAPEQKVKANDEK